MVSSPHPVNYIDCHRDQPPQSHHEPPNIPKSPPPFSPPSLPPRSHAPTLSYLDVSEVLKFRGSNTDIAIQLLSDLIHSETHSLQTLRIRGSPTSAKKRYLDRSLEPLLANLPGCKLSELDIAFNRCDAALDMVGDYLAMPACTLRWLDVEGMADPT